MSTKAQLVKYLKYLKKVKYKTRIKRRCPICGRARAYMRDFDMCRICFKKYATNALIPGLKKSSW